jgi:hypothetical protein
LTRLIGDNTKPCQELPESFAPVPDLLSFDVDEALNQRVVEDTNKHHLNASVNPTRQKSLPNFSKRCRGLSLASQNPPKSTPIGD